MNNNIPNLPLTVTQLNNQVKSSLHQQYQNVNVVGEINNFKKYSSGHVYFTLKDKKSEISCVMFGSYYEQLNSDLKDGEKVVLSGEVTLYIPKGNYQLSVKKIVFFNQKGDIYKEYEKLKKQLNSEGLFEINHKRTIPRFPNRVGLITSLNGSVVKDITNIAKRRSQNVELIISSSSVQGFGAANEVIQALDELLSYSDNDKIDIIIIARGGGSFEDLHSFNNEKLARKVFDCDIPIISAIGHETDFTILDFVSDLRASTPSEAAELSIPDDNEFIQSLDMISERMLKQIVLKIDAYKENYNLLNNHLKEFNPKLLIENYKIKILSIKDKMMNVQKNIYNNVDDKIQYYDKLLYHNNPYNILNKGFSVISNKENQFIKRMEDMNLEDKVKIRFQDGSASAIIKSKEHSNEKE